METHAYRTRLAVLRLGKRLPEAVYLHREALPHLDEDLRELVRRAVAMAGLDAAAYDVVKFSTVAPRVSLLSYPGFFEVAFPLLAASWVVDLATGRVGARAYGANGNAPILHRKEVLLPPGHHAIPAFAQLTEAIEAAGLFGATHKIGLAKQWEARLAAAGYVVEGHALRRTEHPAGAALAPPAGGVQRHRTALNRFRLSTPMQALWRHGYLSGEFSVFDFGCGRGDDLGALRERGIEAAGWDPFFAPETPRREADVVNLGFVLNVIEDPLERRAALEAAYALARRLLVVSVLLGGAAAAAQHSPFADGVLTSRGTFQKYFEQGELREYIERCLGREPIAVGPGMFFVFREDAEEQRFLAARQLPRRGNADMPAPPQRAPGPEAIRPARARRTRVSRWAAHAALVEEFWNTCLGLGRLPADDEFADEPALRASVGSPAAVLRRLLAERGADTLDAARADRADDVLVYLALNLFERRRSFGALPDRERRDVKAFWANFGAAQQAATALLFGAGDAAKVRDACTAAARQGLGHLDGEHALSLHATLVPRLPPLLRVYIGCAARLYGDVEACDMVKLHARSAKVTLTTYDDFATKAVPELVQRVKIDLRAQRIEFFAYGDAVHPRPLLFLKSRYLARDSPGYAEQRAFDEALDRLALFDFSGYGPDRHTFLAGLAQAGLAMDGLTLRRVTAIRHDRGSSSSE